jgi:ABC-type multidrug transport system permease subunit
MTYNMTNYTSADTVIEFAQATDQLTGGFFFPLMLGLALLISFTALKNYEFKKAALASTFMTSTLAGLLFVAGLVSSGVLSAFFVLFILALLANFIE